MNPGYGGHNVVCADGKGGAYLIKIDTTDPRVPGYSGRTAATAGTAPHEKQRKKRKKQLSRSHRKRLAPKRWVASLRAAGIATSVITQAFEGKSASRLNRFLAQWRKDAGLTGIAELGGNLNGRAYNSMKTALAEARAEGAACAPLV